MSGLIQPGMVRCGVSPITLLITRGGETGLAILDDEISQNEIIGWLKDRGISG